MLHLIKTLTGHNSSIYKIIPLDQRSFLSLGGDGFMVRWNIDEADGHLIAHANDKFFAGCLVNKELLVAGAFSGLLYWLDLKKKQIIKIVQHHKKAIFSVTFYQDQLWTVSEDGCLTSWDIYLMHPKYSFMVSPYGLRSLEIIDDQILAVGDMNGNLFYIDSKQCTIKYSIKAHDKTIFSILRTDHYLYTGGRDAMLRKWEVEGLQKIDEIPAHWFTINDIKHFSDLIITASRDKKIRVWTHSLELIQSIHIQEQGHINSVNCLSIIDHDKVLVSGGDDRSIKIWIKK